MQFSKEQVAYIESEVRRGLSLEQAIGQSEVLEEQAKFKDNLLLALIDPNVRQVIIDFVGHELMEPERD